MNIRFLPNIYDKPSYETNTIYLAYDNWDDFGFVTSLHVSFCDEKNEVHDIGITKIGFQGQTTCQSTYDSLNISNKQIQVLPDEYFSVGQDIDYYKIISALPDKTKELLFKSLKDIVYQPKLMELADDEDVFGQSLLRNVSLSAIEGQFKRIIDGTNPLTDFEFKFIRQKTDSISGLELPFNVKVGTKPSTNIHAIIGRNGVGKTTILNGMIQSITNNTQSKGKFYSTDLFCDSPISKNYFSSLVSVSFSAFDSFEPPTEQSDPSKGTCYFYIGLKTENKKIKDLSDIHNNFISALKSCFNHKQKKERWLTAINTLESDENFASMELKNLTNFDGKSLPEKAKQIIKKMSSGHFLVLLTITKLVDTVEEKTLVLIDEPESHLHPPLLSAFIRTLSDLLLNRNGLAIIATHSPVVLQEIPKQCVSKISRHGMSTNISRPSIETFGENIGILTREIFGLEVSKSGFHDLLFKSVETGATYKEIVDDYNNQLGLEARALLKALVVNRDRGQI